MEIDALNIEYILIYVYWKLKARQFKISDTIYKWYVVFAVQES